MTTVGIFNRYWTTGGVWIVDRKTLKTIDKIILPGSGEVREVLQGDALGMDAFERFAGHLEKNQVDLSKTPATLGPVLHMNPETERFRSGYGAISANALLTRDCREPFVVREKV